MAPRWGQRRLEFAQNHNIISEYVGRYPSVSAAYRALVGEGHFTMSLSSLHRALKDQGQVDEGAGGSDTPSPPPNGKAANTGTLPEPTQVRGAQRQRSNTFQFDPVHKPGSWID